MGEGNEKCSVREREREKRKPARKRNKVSVLIKSESGRRTWKMERETNGVWKEGLKNGT